MATNRATKATDNSGQRVAELRRSNAAGKHHDRRTRRHRTRATVRRASLKEQEA